MDYRQNLVGDEFTKFSHEGVAHVDGWSIESLYEPQTVLFQFVSQTDAS